MTIPLHPRSAVSPHPQALLQLFAEPKGKLYLLYGNPVIFRFSLAIEAQMLGKGIPIAVVDGCNRFDVHAIINSARERGIDPDALLNRIFISRGFTCYQMEAAITTKLPAFLQRINSRVALIFGLLDTFYDEQAPLREARQILNRVLKAFRTMKGNNVSLLLACTERTVFPEERNQLFTQLTAAMDSVYHLSLDPEQQLKIILEHHSDPVLIKGANHHGTHSADLYQHHRQRTGKLVKIPAGVAQRRPGIVR